MILSEEQALIFTLSKNDAWIAVAEAWDNKEKKDSVIVVTHQKGRKCERESNKSSECNSQKKQTQQIERNKGIEG